jgi:hypothetical protein
MLQRGLLEELTAFFHQEFIPVVDRCVLKFTQTHDRDTASAEVVDELPEVWQAVLGKLIMNNDLISASEEVVRSAAQKLVLEYGLFQAIGFKEFLGRCM